MNGQERTILFLIADTGAGHRSAANAIRNAIGIIAQREQEKWFTQQQESAGQAATPLTSTAPGMAVNSGTHSNRCASFRLLLRPIALKSSMPLQSTAIFHCAGQ